MSDKITPQLEKRSRSELIAEVKKYRELVKLHQNTPPGKTQSEDLLISYQIRYKDLFNKSQDGIIILEFETGKILDANLAVENILGYSKYELVGQEICTVESFKSLFDNKVISKQFWKLNKTPYKHLLIQSKNGNDIDVELTWGKYHLPDNIIVQCEIRDVSESRQIIKKLKQERKILRTLIDSLPDLIYIKDKSCKKIISNLADVHYVGFDSEKEVLGKDDFDLYPKEIAEKLFEDDKKILESGEPILNREEWVTDKEGNGHWLQTSKIPLTNDKEKVIGLMGIGRDITERKELEESLEEERNFLRKLIDNLPDLIYLKDADRKYLLNNIVHLKSLGVERQEDVLGKTCADFHPPELACKYEQDEIEILSTGHPLLNKEEAVHYDNKRETQWHLTSKLPLFDDKGNITGIIGISRNITEQKRSEEKINKLNRMYELQSYINQLIVRANDIQTLLKSVCEILVQTGEFKMTWIGLYERESGVIEQTISFGETGDFLEKLNNRDKNKEFYNQPTAIVIETEEFYATNNIKKDNRMKELHELAERNGFHSFCAFPLTVFDQLYGIIYIYSDKKYFFDEREMRLLDEVAGDISFCIETIFNNQKREENEQDMLKAIKKAEEANRLKNSFLARISHEFRTPLTGIIGSCSLLWEFYSADANETVTKLFDSLNENTDRLLTTITHILDIANIESDIFKIDCEPLPLKNIVVSVCDSLEKQISKRNLKLKIEQPDTEIIVQGDKYCLKGAMKNILDNAIKFSDRGIITITIRSNEKYGECVIKDEGRGIGDEYQEHLFELFSQEDVGYSRQYDGPGLGLALTQKYISFMKGEIEINSKKGIGTTVTIRIPLL